MGSKAHWRCRRTQFQLLVTLRLHKVLTDTEERASPCRARRKPSEALPVFPRPGLNAGLFATWLWGSNVAEDTAEPTRTVAGHRFNFFCCRLKLKNVSGESRLRSRRSPVWLRPGHLASVTDAEVLFWEHERVFIGEMERAFTRSHQLSVGHRPLGHIRKSNCCSALSAVWSKSIGERWSAAKWKASGSQATKRAGV